MLLASLAGAIFSTFSWSENRQAGHGLIVPGLRKVGGRYLVPVAALAAAIDALAHPEPSPETFPTRHTVVVPASPIAPRRGRVPDAVRLGHIRAWGMQVIVAFDDLTERQCVAEATALGERLQRDYDDQPAPPPPPRRRAL